MDLLTLRRLLARPIAYHKLFAKLAGGACPGVFLSQLWYWSEIQDRTAPDSGGWFYKSLPEWYEETGLSKRELETARRELTGRGFLTDSTRGYGSEKRVYWRLNMDKLLVAMEGQLSKPEEKPALQPIEPILPYRESHILQNGKNNFTETVKSILPICENYKEHRLPTQTTSIELATPKKNKRAGTRFSDSNLSSPAPPLPAQPTAQIVPPVARPPRDIAAEIAELEQARTRLSGANRKAATQKIAALKQQLPITMPWPSLEFEQAWADWEAHKKKKRSWYASNVTEQKQLDKLHEDMEGDEARAIAAINWSILKNYEGIFPQPPDRQVQSPYTPTVTGYPAGKPSQVTRRLETMAAVAELDRAEDSRSNE